MWIREKLSRTIELKIKRLSEDKVFGILTRNGLEEKMREIGGTFDGLFIDVKDMGEMNRSLGYKWVNKRMRMIFEQIRKDAEHDLLIGRFFSGDEVVILFRHTCQWPQLSKLSRVTRNAAEDHSFKFHIRVVANITSLDDIKLGKCK